MTDAVQTREREEDRCGKEQAARPPRSRAQTYPYAETAKHDGHSRGRPEEPEERAHGRGRPSAGFDENPPADSMFEASSDGRVKPGVASQANAAPGAPPRACRNVGPYSLAMPDASPGEHCAPADPGDVHRD